MNLHPSKILFHDEKLMFEKTGVFSLAMCFSLKQLQSKRGLVSHVQIQRKINK